MAIKNNTLKHQTHFADISPEQKISIASLFISPAYSQCGQKNE
jgi:hypothetical protein